jgi:hypothetical protein
MKLGASYNVFDGLELIEYSIRSIRSNVDYISVVYQDLSNLGNQSKVSSLQILRELKSNRFIDEIIKYEPNKALRGHGNEIMKRNIGLESCQRNGCTHFMTIDVDEMYKEDQLRWVKQLVEKDDYDTTACLMQTYYKTPEWVSNPPETYYVPLIYKCDERRFSMSTRWPIQADPTRRLEHRKMILLTRDQIEMHHYSYVRKDIRAKFDNSSANTNWENRERLALHHDNWVPGQEALFAGKAEKRCELIKADNYFNINI